MEKQIFNVMQYGAAGRKKNSDTLPIQKAIDEANKAGAALLRQLQAVTAERDAAQIGVAQCAQVQDALRRVLPMSEAWFRREFDGLCDHEPGECHCDREAHARTDINIALAALGKMEDAGR